jgi:hypothetical protein
VKGVGFMGLGLLGLFEMVRMMMMIIIIVNEKSITGI